MDQNPNTIKSQEDFAAYVQHLAEWKWKGTPADSPLHRYLEHLATYVQGLDMEELYSRLDKPVPEEPTWELFGMLLYAAGIYYEL